MNGRSLLRDVVMLAAAAMIGWWAHSTTNPVHADSAHPDDVTVQMGIAGGHGTIGLYNPSLHAVFVYPLDSGDSHIGCMYALSFTKAGAPIDRVNCPNVSLTGH